jgi:pimeloyl-ACP methyl ester carboxylesterase
MTGDVAAILDDLSVEKANYWGYSMGGAIGYQLAKYYPSRFNSYIIGGQSPYTAQSKAHKQYLAGLDTMLRIGTEEGPEAIVSFREKQLGRTLSTEEKKRLLDNDFKALQAAYHNESNWPSTGDAPALLSSITVPCLLYAGEQDPVYDGAKEAVKHIQNARFISFPGLDHGQGSTRSDLVLPHVKRFLSSFTRKEL